MYINDILANIVLKSSINSYFLLVKERRGSNMWANRYEYKGVYIGRLCHDSDLLESINKYCDQNNIRVGYVSVLGALKKANLGFYDQQERKYYNIPVDKNLEIVNCYGNISVKDDEPFAHIHLVVSDNTGKTYAGHTMPGCIVFAGEIYIHQVQGQDLKRKYDEVTGLPLWEEPPSDRFSNFNSSLNAP